MTDRPLNLAIFDMGLLKAPFFLGLREHLAPTVNCLYWSRRLLMRRYAQSAGIDIHPRSLAEPQASAAIDDASLRAAIGIKDRKLRGDAKLGPARKRYAEIETFLDTQAIDALLVWNGSNKLLSMAIHAARRRGIPVIHAEHGYFPGTMQLDLEGVNAASSLSRRAHSGQAQRPPQPALDARLDAIIDAVRGDAPSRVVRTAIPARYLQSRSVRAINALFYRLRPYGLGKPMLPGYQDPPLPADGFVFYPLQVRKDSQLLLHSPIWGNDHAAVIASLSEQLALMNPPRRLVVKFHPQEARLAQIANDALIRRFPDVTFVCNLPATELIRRARFVVTINSSVGFEAILLDRPLVTLGDSFYALPSVAEVVRREADLADALEAADRQPVRTEARRALLRHCLDAFAAGTYFDHRPDSYAAVAERIRTLLLPTVERCVVPLPLARTSVAAFEERRDRRRAVGG
jgi:capsular polysaccharide export protein